jgi:hypothetical protein
MPRDERFAGVSWADLDAFITDLMNTHRLVVSFGLDTTGVRRGYWRVWARLHDLADAAGDEGFLQAAAGEFRVSGAGQAAQMMLVLHQAYAAYQADPWRWTAYDRRRAVAAGTDGRR